MAHTDAPPLVLLHGTGTGSTGWLTNVGPPSSSHRVLAVDIMGRDAASGAPAARPLRPPAVLLFLRVGPDAVRSSPGLALRLMSPGFGSTRASARQFVLEGRRFRAADPRASVFPTRERLSHARASFPRASVFPTPYGDEELFSLRGTVLVGGREPTFDPRRAVTRARRLIPARAHGARARGGHQIAMEAVERVKLAVLRLLTG